MELFAFFELSLMEIYHYIFIQKRRMFSISIHHKTVITIHHKCEILFQIKCYSNGKDLIRASRQILLVTLSQLIKPYSPRNHEKTIGFLMISGGIEVN